MGCKLSAHIVRSVAVATVTYTRSSVTRTSVCKFTVLLVLKSSCCASALETVT